MTSQPLRTVFYLSTDKLEKIKHEPHLAWDYFQSTKLDVYAPRIDKSEIKLVGVPDSKDRWHVDIIPRYTHQHFCLLTRIDSINIVSKDRAYQNGGGFALLLATPKEGNQDTDEFTVFGICPFEERESLQWSRFFVYYKDVDVIFKKSEDAQIVVEKDSQFSYVFVMIPWKLAEPLTPFITKRIGLNFWSAQAIDAEIPVQVHMLLRSEKLIAEQKLRDYVLYELEEPQSPRNQYEIAYQLDSKHLPSGTPSKVQVALNSPRDSHLTVRLIRNAAEVASTETDISKGINYITIQFASERLDLGENQLQLEISGKNVAYSENMKISVYDLNRIFQMKDSIDRLRERKAPTMEIAESTVTLEYLVETSMRDLKELKPYSSFAELQNRFDRILDGISKVESNESLFVKGKTIRMGLRSRQDNSLQPYSIYIPNTFSPGSCGLMVLLHGSGTNDTSMLAKPSRLAWYEKTGMIAVAPFARGESHYYLPKEAMEEIAELTEKMMQMFSIPTEKIVLAGFSMGGFGVINTYFHRPDLYQNLMVISGGFDLKPFIAEPDWSTDEVLQKLARTNLIIFHGDSDLNMPYKQQKPIHAKLKRLNPHVEIVIAKGVGHEDAPEWEEKIVEYLSNVAARAC